MKVEVRKGKKKEWHEGEQAEEIAAISDNLLPPEGADDFVSTHAPVTDGGGPTTP